MKVRATKDGYYHHMYRKEGAIFTLMPGKCRDRKLTPEGVFTGEYGPERVMTVEEQFSKRWMEPYHGDEPAMQETVKPDPYAEKTVELPQEEMSEKPARGRKAKSVI